MWHHIIVKYNELVQDKEKMREEIDELFQHITEIPGIHKVETIKNVVDRPNRYDLMIRITMELEALPTYDESKWHKEWKENYAKYLMKKTIFDSDEVSK